MSIEIDDSSYSLILGDDPRRARSEWSKRDYTF